MKVKEKIIARKTLKKRIELLSKNPNINWEDFDPSTKKISQNLIKNYPNVVSLFHLGTTEIEEAIKESNLNNKLSEKEIQKVVLQILLFFSKEQIWYKAYFDKKNKFYAKINKKQHVQLTLKFYSAGVLMKEVITQTYQENNKEEELENLFEKTDKIQISDKILIKILQEEASFEKSFFESLSGKTFLQNIKEIGLSILTSNMELTIPVTSLVNLKTTTKNIFKSLPLSNTVLKFLKEHNAPLDVISLYQTLKLKPLIFFEIKKEAQTNQKKHVLIQLNLYIQLFWECYVPNNPHLAKLTNQENQFTISNTSLINVQQTKSTMNEYTLLLLNFYEFFKNLLIINKNNNFFSLQQTVFKIIILLQKTKKSKFLNLKMNEFKKILNQCYNRVPNSLFKENISEYYLNKVCLGLLFTALTANKIIWVTKHTNEKQINDIITTNIDQELNRNPFLCTPIFFVPYITTNIFDLEKEMEEDILTYDGGLRQVLDLKLAKFFILCFEEQEIKSPFFIKFVYEKITLFHQIIKINSPLAILRKEKINLKFNLSTILITLDKNLNLKMLPYNITFEFNLIDEILETIDSTVIEKSNIYTETNLTEKLIKNQINKVAAKNNESSITSQLRGLVPTDDDDDDPEQGSYYMKEEKSSVVLTFHIKINVSSQKSIKILTGSEETNQVTSLKILTSILMQSIFCYNNIISHHELNHKVKYRYKNSPQDLVRVLNTIENEDFEKTIENFNTNFTLPVDEENINFDETLNYIKKLKKQLKNKINAELIAQA